VVVRIYQLKSIARMEEAEFDAIWRRDREVLADDILKIDEMYLYPNQRMARTFRREDAATHVVAVAIFRHPAGQAWRTIYELPPPPGDERCAAQSADPTASPPPVRDPRYVFYLEDYYIEPGGPDEPPTDAGVPTAAGGSACPAPCPPPRGPVGEQPPNAPQRAQPPQRAVAPRRPHAPTAPSLPSAPAPRRCPAPRRSPRRPSR
jgi:hypothetical protein